MGNLNYFSSGRASADAERVANAMSRPARPDNVYLIEMDAGGESWDYKDIINRPPPVIGPFPDSVAAEAFAEEVGLGENCYTDGGYSTYWVIDGADCSPEEYRKENAEHIEWVLERRAEREAYDRERRPAGDGDIQCEAIHTWPHNAKPSQQCRLVAGHNCCHEVDNVSWSHGFPME